jgi:hypothetical protein
VMIERRMYFLTRYMMKKTPTTSEIRDMMITMIE